MQEKFLCSNSLKTKQIMFPSTLSWRKNYVSSKHVLLTHTEGETSLHNSLIRGYVGLHFRQGIASQSPETKA